MSNLKRKNGQVLHHISKEKSRHGRDMYYFRVGHGPRIRLRGVPGSRLFDIEYERASSEGQSSSQTNTDVLDVLMLRMKNAKSRIKKKNGEFDLTAEWALEELNKQNFCCKLTGLAFIPWQRSKRINPLSPSLDRINPKGGYTKDNVRIVCFAINMMMLDWGEDVLSMVASSYLSHSQSRTKTAKVPNLGKSK